MRAPGSSGDGGSYFCLLGGELGVLGTPLCCLGGEVGVLGTPLCCLNSCPEPATAGRWYARLQMVFPVPDSPPFHSAFLKSAKGLGEGELSF